MIKKNLIKIHDNDVDRIMSNHNSYLQIHDLMIHSLNELILRLYLHDESKNRKFRSFGR